MNNSQGLYFVGPRLLELRDESTPVLAPKQVRVHTKYSGISAGTEMLLYRGEAPEQMAADETLSALSGSLAYPLKYGYAAVGDVVELGAGVADDWLGQTVFVFNPHEREFVANVDELYKLPAGLAPELGVLLPTVETALNFLHDGRPVAGEDVVVIGQGVVGQLTTALLGCIPLNSLITLDRLAVRREMSCKMGATQSLDPAQSEYITPHLGQADLCYELSGSPTVLNQAIAMTGFSGRVVIGSWYGTKTAPLDLGGRFHRSRIQLISSQVSTLSPSLQSRWSKQRRMDFALKLLQTLKLDQLITHRINFNHVADAYRLLDEQPDKALQMVLSYEDTE